MKVYLDNASTTRVDPRVLAKMLPYFDETYGNPGSIHNIGISARYAIKKARKQVAKFLSASPEQIIFTSGGTEANNLALQGISEYLIENGKCHIITSATEHDSVLNTVEKMCIKDGFHSTILPASPDGTVSTDLLIKSITPNTGLISIMCENNEVGAINAIRNIASICHEKDILFHTDCVQAAGDLKIDVEDIGCDFATISSHKIHGPKGVGAVFVRDIKILNPQIIGGNIQEFGLRGGTENVPGIVGFGEACEISLTEYDYNHKLLETLKYEFYNRLAKNSNAGFFNINGSMEKSGSKILNIQFPNVDGETLLLMLDSAGIFVSSGSACRSHESSPSKTLIAMGIDPEDAMNSIRVSFSRFNSLDQVIYAADKIVGCVKLLKGEE